MAKKKSEQKEEGSWPMRLTDPKDEEEQLALEAEAKEKPEEKSE